MHSHVAGQLTPLSMTKGTLPASWQGTKPLSRMGRPMMRDSTMVPGPALVMMMSQAAIHSSMLSTKPCTLMFMPSGQLLHTPNCEAWQHSHAQKIDCRVTG